MPEEPNTERALGDGARMLAQDLDALDSSVGEALTLIDAHATRLANVENLATELGDVAIDTGSQISNLGMVIDTLGGRIAALEVLAPPVPVDPPPAPIPNEPAPNEPPQAPAILTDIDIPAIRYVHTEGNDSWAGTKNRPLRSLEMAWEKLMWGEEEYKVPTGTIIIYPGIHTLHERLYKESGGIMFVGYGAHGRGGSIIQFTGPLDHDMIWLEPAGMGSGHGIILKDLALKQQRGSSRSCIQLDGGYQCHLIGVRTQFGRYGVRMSGGSTTLGLTHCGGSFHEWPDPDNPEINRGGWIGITDDDPEVIGKPYRFDPNLQLSGGKGGSTMWQVVIDGATQLDAVGNVAYIQAVGSAGLKLDGILKCEGGYGVTPTMWKQLVTIESSPLHPIATYKPGRLRIKVDMAMDNIPESVQALVTQIGTAQDGSSITDHPRGVVVEDWITHMPERPIVRQL